MEKEHIIGTASLEGSLVRTVFILPNKQGKNAGSLLMYYLEEMARKANIPCLTVSSSITAEGFYRKLGYRVLRNEYYGDAFRRPSLELVNIQVEGVARLSSLIYSLWLELIAGRTLFPNPYQYFIQT